MSEVMADPLTETPRPWVPIRGRGSGWLPAPGFPDTVRVAARAGRWLRKHKYL